MHGMEKELHKTGFYRPELEWRLCRKFICTKIWPFQTSKIHNSCSWAQIWWEVCGKNVGIEVLKLLTKTCDLTFCFRTFSQFYRRSAGVIFGLRLYWVFWTCSLRQSRLVLSNKRYWAETLQSPSSTIWGMWRKKEHANWR